jgi:sigma-B regulation protein RsbU (phosphoserine phosphatase)
VPRHGRRFSGLRLSDTIAPAPGRAADIRAEPSIERLETRIRRVESLLILLSIAAIAAGDYLFGPRISLGYLYLIPLSYSALTHRWSVTGALVVLCVLLREAFGPIEFASWGLIARDWILVGVFLAVVTALHRLGSERAALFRQAREQRDELSREVDMAAAVQRQVLDQHRPPDGPLDVAATMRPAKGVGGDYYDFLSLERDRFGVVIADVAGKGLPAALLMPAVKIALRTLVSEYYRLSDILRQLNATFVENSPSASYFTMACAVFDPERTRMVYSNAGHLAVLHFRAVSGEVDWLTTGGPPVGLLPGVEFDTGEVEFAPGDVFVFYTDGLTESHDAQGFDFGRERLATLVRQDRDRPAAELVSVLHAGVDRFRGAEPQIDDATVIVVRVPAPVADS